MATFSNELFKFISGKEDDKKKAYSTIDDGDTDEKPTPGMKN